MARFAGFMAVTAAATLLAACAETVERAPIATVIDPFELTTGVEAGAQARGATPNALGTQVIEVRVDDPSKDADDPTREIEGATCRVRGADFSATVLSPIGVKVPVYRHRTAPIAIACDKSGFAPAAAWVEAHNALRDRPLDDDDASADAAQRLAGEIGRLFAPSADDAVRDFYEYRSFALNLLPLDADADAADAAPSDALERSYRLPELPPLLLDAPSPVK